MDSKNSNDILTEKTYDIEVSCFGNEYVGDVIENTWCSTRVIYSFQAETFYDAMMKAYDKRNELDASKNQS